MDVLKAIAGFTAIILFCFQLSVLIMRVVRQSEPFEAKAIRQGYMMALLGAFIVFCFTPSLASGVMMVALMVLVGCFNVLIVYRHQAGRKIRSFGVVNIAIVFMALVICIHSLPSVVDLVS